MVEQRLQHIRSEPYLRYVVQWYMYIESDDTSKLPNRVHKHFIGAHSTYYTRGRKGKSLVETFQPHITHHQPIRRANEEPHHPATSKTTAFWPFSIILTNTHLYYDIRKVQQGISSLPPSFGELTFLLVKIVFSVRGGFRALIKVHFCFRRVEHSCVLTFGT